MLIDRRLQENFSRIRLFKIDLKNKYTEKTSSNYKNMRYANVIRLSNETEKRILNIS